MVVFVVYYMKMSQKRDKRAKKTTLSIRGQKRIGCLSKTR